MPRTPRETIIRKLKAIKRHASWIVKHSNDIRLLNDKARVLSWALNSIVLEIGVNANEAGRLVDHVLDALGYKPRNVGEKGEKA